jgi:hypothetical protein
MMAEYIEREAAEDAVGEAHLKGLNPLWELRDVPAADVAPVVRCKDCKYQDDCWNCCHPRHHGILLTTYPLDFCSYGERRDGE